MIDPKAFFKVSYGLYLVGSGDKTKGNAFVSNTVFQVSADPVKFAACSNKDNYTTELIQKTGVFSVSILSQETPADIYGVYGYQSGRDIDKLENGHVKYGESGVPIILDSAIAWFEFKVIETVDVGTHLMFIGELMNSELLEENADPLTYAYYREVKNGVAPKNAPTYIDKSTIEEKPSGKKYKCLVCGYIHDEGESGEVFDDLAEDWVCPICTADKSNFDEM